MEIQTKCSQKACVFPANGPDGYCRYHREMFTVFEEDDGRSVLTRRRGVGTRRRNGLSIEDHEAISEVFESQLSVVSWRDAWKVNQEKINTRDSDRRLFGSLRIKKLHHKYKLAGRCLRCRAPAQPPHPFCNDHFIESQAFKRTRILARRKIKMCLDCGRATVARAGRCNPCWETWKEIARKSDSKRYGRLKSKRLCIRCLTRPTEPPSPYCTECKNKRREHQRGLYLKYLEAGLCTKCGGPRNNSTLKCSNCRVTHRTKKFPLPDGGGMEATP
jgi:hypothetical protein